MPNSTFVIDTNVLISAIVFRSENPRKVIERCFSSGRVMLSEQVEKEYRDKLLDDKFDIFISKESRKKILALLLNNCRQVEPTKVLQASRDIDDNKFLELALATKATCIITGDKDQLVLHPFENIPILTPKEFLDKY